MHLGYYFRDNFKKAGFTQGKLVRALFEKQVVEGKKGTDVFIEEQTEIVMKTEREKTESQIEVLSSEIKLSEISIKEVQKKKDADKNKIRNLYNEKIETLKNEKKRVESCFETYSIELAEKAKSTNDMFEKLQGVIYKYAEDTKDYISKQSDKTKNAYDNVIGHAKDFILDDIKRDFLANKAKNEAENVDKKGKSHNGIYIFALILLSIYDVFFGQQAVHDAVPRLGPTLSNFLGLGDRFSTMVEFIIAILLVVVGIILIHFLTEECKKGGINKQISLICMAIVILVFMGYAYTSISTEQKEAGVDIMQLFFGDNLELIFRILIIPSLFVGDLIINRINADTLFGTSRFGSAVSKLINRGLFFLKKHSFTKYVEEEKKHYGEILDGLKKFPIPGSQEVFFQVEKIESKIMPISNELINKRNECEAKVKDIDSKIEDILQEEKLQLNNIDNLYAHEIDKEELLIKRNNIAINTLNEQLGNAYISVKGGISLGLID